MTPWLRTVPVSGFTQAGAGLGAALPGTGASLAQPAQVTAPTTAHTAAARLQFTGASSGTGHGSGSCDSTPGALVAADPANPGNQPERPWFTPASTWYAIAAAATTLSESPPEARASGCIGMRTA